MQLVSHQRLPEEYLRRQVRTAESRPITFTVIGRLFQRMGHPDAVFIRRWAGRPAGIRVESAVDPAAERAGFVPPARDEKERGRRGAVGRRTARKKDRGGHRPSWSGRGYSELNTARFSVCAIGRERVSAPGQNRIVRGAEKAGEW